MLRGIGFVLAIVLGAVAVWLIVTSTEQKRIELGILAGLWGILLGAFSVFGSRHPQAAAPAPLPVDPGQELMTRAASEMQRADEAAARRHFETRLEQMLRQEIQTTLAQEIASLRDEVASLRNDLLEKVGGQLRLERIETTRVIGSDIEALQQEIDMLKRGRPVVEAVHSRALPRVLDQPPAPEPSPSTAIDPVPGPAPAPEPAPAVAPEQMPVWRREPTPAPEPVTAEPEPEPVAAAAPEPEPAPAAAPEPEPPAATGTGRTGAADFFGELPRLRPFTDFELDPIEPTAEAGPRISEPISEPPAAAEPLAAEQQPPEPSEPEPSEAAEPQPVNGTEPRANGAARPQPAGQELRTDLTVPSGARHGRADTGVESHPGRRHRAPDDEDNMLARILARESTGRD